MAFFQTKELIDHVFGVAAPELSKTHSSKDDGLDPECYNSGMYIDPAVFLGHPSDEENRSPIGVFNSQRPGIKNKEGRDREKSSKGAAINTGFPGLDKILGELKAGSLTLLAGLPGVGKTSLALNIAEHAATKINAPVAFFSFDIDKEELLTRLVSARSRVKLDSIYSGFITPPERESLDAALVGLYRAPIYIDDNARHSLTTIREQIKEHKDKLDLKLIVIDCMQLIKEKGHSEKALREIGFELKDIAREFSLPVISLYQLPQSWQNKKIVPHPSYILKQGAVKNYCADKIVLIYRRGACRECRSQIELCTCSLNHDTRLVVSGGADSTQEVAHLRFLNGSVHFEIPDAIAKST